MPTQPTFHGERRAPSTSLRAPAGPIPGGAGPCGPGLRAGDSRAWHLPRVVAARAPTSQGPPALCSDGQRPTPCWPSAWGPAWHGRAHSPGGLWQDGASSPAPERGLAWVSSRPPPELAGPLTRQSWATGKTRRPPRKDIGPRCPRTSAEQRVWAGGSLGPVPRLRGAHPAGRGGSGALLQLRVCGEALPDDVGGVVLGAQPRAAFEDEIDEEKLDPSVESCGGGNIPQFTRDQPARRPCTPGPAAGGQGPRGPPRTQAWHGGPGGVDTGQGKQKVR